MIGYEPNRLPRVDRRTNGLSLLSELDWQVTVGQLPTANRNIDIAGA
jgi:hypothetical protein